MLTATADRITLNRGEQAAVVVPEGRIVVLIESDPGGSAGNHVVVLLETHAGSRVELARFAAASDLVRGSDMISVALAALEAMR